MNVDELSLTEIETLQKKLEARRQQFLLMKIADPVGFAIKRAEDGVFDDLLEIIHKYFEIEKHNALINKFDILSVTYERNDDSFQVTTKNGVNYSFIVAWVKDPVLHRKNYIAREIESITKSLDIQKKKLKIVNESVVSLEAQKKSFENELRTLSGIKKRS